MMHGGFLGIDDFVKSVRIANQKVTFWKPAGEVINKQLVLNFQRDLTAPRKQSMDSRH